MVYGSFTLRSDPFGFPMVRVRETTYLSLFPVSKYQFEIVVSRKGGSTPFTHNWYEKVLDVNPRCSWWNWSDTPWRLFLTGVLVEEVQSFLHLYGHGYRVPEAEEWRVLCRMAGSLAREPDKWFESMKKVNVVAPVLHWTKHGLFPVIAEGLLEIVKEENEYLAIGKPWRDFQPNLWDPTDTRIINWDVGRLGYLGFRLAWEGTPSIKRPEI